jgi:hypothetical protein
MLMLAHRCALCALPSTLGTRSAHDGALCARGGLR